MPIPVLIITGFLGCGKTSFLRHLLPMCGEVGMRPVLIINEVGDVDVDGELLADLHAEQTRIVGGCICCTLQSRLSATLEEVLDRQAGEIILIECSGLSNPIDVLSALSTPALLPRLAVSHLICLLDGKRAEAALKVVELAKAQVASADLLLLNKADKVSAEQRANVEALAGVLNPHAQRSWTTYGDLGAEALRALLTDPPPVRAQCGCGHDHCHHDHGHHAHRQLPASFCTVALPLPDSVPRAALDALLAGLPAGVIRAKGFAHTVEDGWVVLHKVFDTYDIIPLEGPAPSAGAILICIGQHLDPDDLQARVAALPVPVSP